MAAPVKDGKVWRHRVMVAGVRYTGTFPTKAHALAWEADRRVTGQSVVDKTRTCADAFREYEIKVSKDKRGYRWEAFRLAAFSESKLGAVRLADLNAAHIAAWRDERLKQVAPGSVAREMNLLSNVFSVARKEWKWITESPTTDVARPKSPPHRDRRITPDEIKAICLALGWAVDAVAAPKTKQQRIALAFLFAIETAMRAGEILGLHWHDVGAKSVNLPLTKNGDARKVPLSPRAREILALLPRSDPVFGLLPAQRDALFRKARDRAAIPNLHFHDSRAEAIWRLSKVFDVMELARVIGHRDLKSLLLYYQTDADDLADRLG